MKRLLLVSLVVFIALGIKVQGEETAPLKLVQTITLPAAIKGHFDHFEVDLQRVTNRSSFSTSRQASSSTP